MTFALNRQNLVNHRYKTYDYAGKFSERTDRDEVWFFSKNDCKSILGNSVLSAKRGGISVVARSNNLIHLAQFYDDWLMFKEDETHKKIKMILNSSISNRLKTDWKVPTAKSANLEEGSEIVSEFVKPFVMSAFSAFFGVSERHFKDIVRRIDPAVMVLGMENVTLDKLVEAEEHLLESQSKVVSLIERSRFIGSICSKLEKICSYSTAINVVLNLIADGVHPTIAALSSEILHSTCDSDDSKPHQSNSQKLQFYSDAPFQFIARLAVEDTTVNGITVDKGRRVIACIGQVARKSDYQLAFGAGRHGCPGSSLARSTVSAGLSEFNRLTTQFKCISVKGEWANSIGYRALSYLTIQPMSTS